MNIKKAIAKNIKPFPETVNLCGIQYRIQEKEGLISFRETGGFYGVDNQIVFQRADNGQGCWYMSSHCTFKTVMVSHIIVAFNIVQHYRGDNWGRIPTKWDPLRSLYFKIRNNIFHFRMTWRAHVKRICHYTRCL